MEKIAQTPQERFLELDSLRGLAALTTLLHHFLTDPYIGIGFMVGQWAVLLFFMISGFVICMKLERCQTSLEFIISRFLRLYPVYWASILIASIIVHNFTLFKAPLGLINLDTVLYNLTMIPNYFNVEYLDPVYWTLTTELVFYFLMLLIFALKGIKYIEIIGITWICITLLASLCSTREPSLIPHNIIFSNSLEWINVFIIGIVFYKLKTLGHSWIRHFAILLCILQFFLLHGIVSKYHIFFALIFCIIIFYLFLFNLLRWITLKPLIFLGTISYSLYLIHYKVGLLTMTWVKIFTNNKVILFAIPTLFCLLLATALTFLVEKPCMALLRRFR